MYKFFRWHRAQSANLAFSRRIAQWDGQGRRYYYVQITTRKSQWEVPTQPAPGILTPSQTPVGTENPYGKPDLQQQGQGEVIMNADGSQSVRYPDGSVYPNNGGADGERGLGVRFILRIDETPDTN